VLRRSLSKRYLVVEDSQDHVFVSQAQVTELTAIPKLKPNRVLCNASEGSQRKSIKIEISNGVGKIP
jgi:hypothetical protein